MRSKEGPGWITGPLLFGAGETGVSGFIPEVAEEEQRGRGE
jgi:hypothetical protein